jgi:hypothetical protein
MGFPLLTPARGAGLGFCRKLKFIVSDIVSKRWPDSNDLRPKSLPGAAQVVVAHLDRGQALSAKRESGTANGTFDSIFAGCFSCVVDSDW